MNTAGSGTLSGSSDSDDIEFPPNSTISVKNRTDSSGNLEVTIGGLHDGDDADIIPPGDARYYVAPNGTATIGCDGSADYIWSVTVRRPNR